VLEESEDQMSNRTAITACDNLVTAVIRLQEICQPEAAVAELTYWLGTLTEEPINEKDTPLIKILEILLEAVC
jgi:hypothetical protein